MPTRIRPSADQIAQALSIRYHDLDERVLPWEDAVRAVRDDQRTNWKLAEEWLRAACLDPNPDILVTYAYSHGQIHGILARSADPQAKNPFTVAPFAEFGFAVEGSMATSSVDLHGAYAPESERSNFPPARNGRAYVGTRAGIQNLLDQEKAARRARVAKMRATQSAQAAVFDEVHGGALGLLRGLLAAAGISERGTKNEVAPYASDDVEVDGKPWTSVDIRVYGEDIDRLAALLQRLGVEPVAEGE